MSLPINISAGSRHRFATALVATIVFDIVPLAAGCGGSSSPGSPSPSVPGTGAGRGRATFTIAWPAPTRLIPSASNSIVISLSGSGGNGTHLGSQTISRPPSGQGTSVIAFENMEPGSVIATASAFPTADGTGVAQASGQVPVTIVADETAETSLTMNSTIDRLEISPPAFRFYAVKQTSFTGDITVTPRNAAGEVVLVPKTNFKWTSSAPSTSGIFSTALGYTFQVGGPISVTTLTLRESESGKTATLPLDIHGPLYTVTDLGQQIGTASLSDAYAVNAMGAVAGYAIISNQARPVLWQNGTAQNLGLPQGLDFALARDINDAGVIVGEGGVGTGGFGQPTRGFVWQPAFDGVGQFIGVPPPTSASTASPLYSINNRGQASGGYSTQGDIAGIAFTFDIATRLSTPIPTSSTVARPGTANGINDSGLVVGRSAFQNGSYASQNGATSSLPGMTDVYAVNASGVIAGYRVLSSPPTAAIFQNNQVTPLFPAGTATSSMAYGLNNKGAVVGTSVNSTVAFIWAPGINGIPNESSVEALNALIPPNQGWQLSIARDINDRGEIVGVGFHNGRRSAFLLTPIP